MAPPLPQGQQGQAPTPDQIYSSILNSLLTLFQAAQLAEVVHLSPTRSINLGKVSRYETVELMEEQTTGTGKTAETVEVAYDPPRYASALYFEGGDEPFWLSDDPVLNEQQEPIKDSSENAIFRKAWQRHARMTGELYALLDGTPLAAAQSQQGGQQ